MALFKIKGSTLSIIVISAILLFLFVQVPQALVFDNYQEIFNSGTYEKESGYDSDNNFNDNSFVCFGIQSGGGFHHECGFYLRNVNVSGDIGKVEMQIADNISTCCEADITYDLYICKVSGSAVNPDNDFEYSDECDDTPVKLKSDYAIITDWLHVDGKDKHNITVDTTYSVVAGNYYQMWWDKTAGTPPSGCNCEIMLEVDTKPSQHMISHYYDGASSESSSSSLAYITLYKGWDNAAAAAGSSDPCDGLKTNGEYDEYDSSGNYCEDAVDCRFDGVYNYPLCPTNNQVDQYTPINQGDLSSSSGRQQQQPLDFNQQFTNFLYEIQQLIKNILGAFGV